MNIDIEKLKKLTADADKIFISPEGEEVLIQLLAIQEQVDEAIKAAKAKLEKTALELNPLFSSIQADKIKVFYRAYGSKYKIDESKVQFIPKELYTIKTTYAAETDAVDQYIDQHEGKIPDGISEPDREKQISISLKRQAKLEKAKAAEPMVHYR
jgi:hypothetical protein